MTSPSVIWEGVQIAGCVNSLTPWAFAEGLLHVRVFAGAWAMRKRNGAPFVPQQGTLVQRGEVILDSSVMKRNVLLVFFFSSAFFFLFVKKLIQLTFLAQWKLVICRSWVQSLLCHLPAMILAVIKALGASVSLSGWWEGMACLRSRVLVRPET